MLDRHEHTDAASRGIDRAGEGYHQQQRVIVHQGEGDAGRDHQAGSREQELAVIVARSQNSGGDRQQRGAEQGHRGDDAHLKRRKSKRQEIDG